MLVIYYILPSKCPILTWQKIKGGGKGGDLLKYVKSKASNVVIADVAENSIQDAVKRYNELKDPAFSATFIVTDAFKVRPFSGVRHNSKSCVVKNYRVWNF